jgi:glycerophosphoryl diester phosphodiesterase
MKFFVDNHITSIAHRGYSGKYPDNSYKSFRAAYDRNFNMIEVDIQACKTGELIIYHDVMISGTPVSELSLKEILKKKRGILTLKNFFDAFPYKSKELYFDLKGGIKTAYHLFAFLRTWNIDVSNMIAFSFNQKHLDLLEQKMPELRRGFITDNILSVRVLKEIIPHIHFICLHYSVLDEEMIDYCKKRGIFIFTYTMKNKDELNYMQKFRIDGIVTNFKLIKFEP